MEYSYIPDLTYDPAFVDCTCIAAVFFQYKECGAEVWIDTDTDLTTWNTGGVWQNLAGDTCYEIQIGGAGGPIVDPAILFVTEYLGAGELTPCNCCEFDLRTYDVCDTGTTCSGLVSPQLIIDMAAVPGPTPTTIVANDNGSGLDCCYTLNPEIPSCQAPTGVYVSTVVDCEDASCPS